MRATDLKTEYLINPIGVDFLNPCLMWTCDGGVRQTAYRIVAKSNGKTVWDSGKVPSDEMKAVYPIESHSRMRVDWAVSLWDENDIEGEPSHAFFETGLLVPCDWKAVWIAGNYRVNRFKRYPADCFKKTFLVKDVARARLYATACGLYEIMINGKKVGNFCLAPGVTDYRKRIQYQTYDVKELLKEGENEITALLADGWYRGSCGAWGLKNQYGTQTKLLVQLEITGADGKDTTVMSDGSWSWSDGGSIRFADNKDGEIVDARLTPTWERRAKEVKCKVTPSASDNVILCEHERLKAKKIVTPSGMAVLDFGQNIAGYIAFKLNAEEGQTVKLRFGEMLDGNGEFTQKNIQCANKKRTKVTPLQQVIYTAKDGVNEYKTRFAIFGFQYVLVETDADWEPEDFTAIAVYSDMTETLDFDCSSALINKLVENTRWSAKNNHADLPTDCPTRERHGWTGDAQIFCNTAGYLFDYAAFARKYVRMLVDEQRRNGKFTQIVPGGGVDFYMRGMDGSAGWADAGILIPYRMWKLYGDDGIITENYPAMKKYADYLIKKTGKRYITASDTGIEKKYRKDIVNYGQAYGEWAEPDDVHHMTWKDCAVPHPEVATAYTSYVLRCMAEICEYLNKPEGERYSAHSEKTMIAYQALCRTEKYTLDTDRQARLVRPLYFGLLNKEQKEYAQKRLLSALDNYGWRLGTGFLSTPLILSVLMEIDAEYAYKLLENEQMPGWLFMPKNGATTIWEAWEGNATSNGGIASLDHYSKGAVCEWLFSEMCGIKVGKRNSFVIKPVVGGNISYARCEYKSVYGKVACGWKKCGQKTVYSVTVPSNTTARLILKGEEKLLTAGEYEFSF